MTVEIKLNGDPEYVDRLLGAVYAEFNRINAEMSHRFPPVVIDERGTTIPPPCPVEGTIRYTGKHLKHLKRLREQR